MLTEARPRFRAVLLLSFSLISACGPGTPSEALAVSEVLSTVDDGRNDRLTLRTFEKTDGVATESMGVSGYTMMFRTEFEATESVLFSIGGPLLSKGTSITVGDYREPARGFSWDDFLASSQGFRPALRGDRLLLTGRIAFELRESGWVATSLEYEYELDSSNRILSAEAFLGDYYDGGPNCMSITSVGAADTVLVKVGHCSVDPEGWQAVIDGRALVSLDGTMRLSALNDPNATTSYGGGDPAGCNQGIVVCVSLAGGPDDGVFERMNDGLGIY